MCAQIDELFFQGFFSTNEREALSWLKLGHRITIRVLYPNFSLLSSNIKPNFATFCIRTTSMKKTFTLCFFWDKNRVYRRIFALRFLQLFFIRFIKIIAKTQEAWEIVQHIKNELVIKILDCTQIKKENFTE